MEFFVVVAFIAVFIIMLKANQKINELKKQITFLDSKIRDLYDKSFYNYEQIKELSQNSQFILENARPQKDSFQNSTANVEEEIRDNNQIESPAVVNVRAERPLQMPAAENAQTELSQQIPIAENTQTEFSQQMPVVENINNPYQHQVPVSTNMSETTENKNNPTKQFKSFENWLGTKFFNIMASLMIFIGLVLFCTLGYEYITKEMKMAAMFLVSGSFIALGSYFTRKNKSVFSLGLTGCGFGTFFISILLSHIYFQALSDTAAFVMLTAWTALALFLSGKLDSMMLSVTAHMGTAVSICFAFSIGLSEEQIIIPIIYQFASVAVIVAGNLLFFKKTYKFGLFMSESLLVYTSIVMCAVFSEKPSVSAGMIFIIFIMQIAAVSVISYLISMSAAALADEKSIRDVIVMAHILNKILLAIGMAVSVGYASFIIIKNVYHTDSLVIPTFAVCAASIIHIIVSLLLSSKKDFDKYLSYLSVWVNSVMVMISLELQSSLREIFRGTPFIFIFTFFIIGAIYITKYNKLTRTASFLTISEAFFLIVYGFFNIESPYLSILNILFVSTEIILTWYINGIKKRKKYFEITKLSLYLWISIAVIPVVFHNYSKSPVVLIISILSLINIISILFKIYKPNEHVLNITVRCCTIITILFGMLFLSLNESGTLGNVFALKFSYILLTAFLTGICVYKFIKLENTGLQVLAAAFVPCYITALFAGFSDSNGISDIYVNILHCKPFFFIFAIMLTAVYYLKNNNKLCPFIWTVIAIDSLGMLFAGYHQLIHYLSDDKAVIITAILISAAHAVIDGLIFHYSTDYENAQNPAAITGLKIADYFRITFAALSIAINTITKFDIANMDFVFMTLVIINIIYIALKYNRFNRSFDMIVNLTSNFIIYISIIDIAQKLNTRGGIAFNYSIRFIFILLLIALYYLTAERLIHSKSAGLQAYIGLTLTLIVNAACQGLSDIFEIQYIFSIVTLITALICIIAGFTFNKKGLRVYGLIVVIFCVLKLILFDVGQTDSLSRVVAFVVSGIVCFIISGIYNKVESKFINSNETVDNNNQ